MIPIPITIPANQMPPPLPRGYVTVKPPDPNLLAKLRSALMAEIEEAKDSVKEEMTVGNCGFCLNLTGNDPHAKFGWRTCNRRNCNLAAAAQSDRIYAGLVDCPETRADALRWVERNAE